VNYFGKQLKEQYMMDEAVRFVATTGKPARFISGTFSLRVLPRKWNRLLNKLGIKQTNIAMVKIKADSK
jgi:hypothetical protein